jgi:hypothetical protein
MKPSIKPLDPNISSEPRKGSPDPTLEEAEFRRRFLSQFQDQAFEPLSGELDSLAAVAWDAYSHHRKSPRTHKAGSEFDDPEYDMRAPRCWPRKRATMTRMLRRASS